MRSDRPTCACAHADRKSKNFNHPSTICQTYGAGRNILNISRIALKLHCVPKFESNPREIGYAFHRAGAEIEQISADFAKLRFV